MSGALADEENSRELGPPEYLVWRVLTESYKLTNQETSRTQAHKLSCFTDRYLSDEYDRDILLPKIWYRYGRMLEELYIDDSVAFTPSALHQPGQAYYPADRISESDFDHLNEDLKDDIFEASNHIVEKYGELNAEELETIQYEDHYPNRHVRAYGDLRSYLSSIRLDWPNQRTLAEYAEGEPIIFERYLNQMLEYYPKDSKLFDDLYETYLTWDDTIRIMNSQGASGRELVDFVESWIKTLSEAVLRIEYNSNIPDERIEEWTSDRHEIIESFNNKVEEKRASILIDQEEMEELGVISKSYNRTITEEIEEL